MKRLLAPASIVMETIFAIMLIMLSRYLPTTEQVQQTTDKAKTATSVAGRQIQTLRKSIDDVRKPELVTLGNQAAATVEGLSNALDSRVLDPSEFIRVMKGVQDAAEGIESAAEAIDREDVLKVADSLQAFADILEGELMPAASTAAVQIERYSNAALLQTEQLVAIIGDNRVDLTPLKKTSEVLGSLDTNFADLDRALAVDLEPVKKSVLSAADAVGIVAHTVEIADVENPITGNKVFPGAGGIATSLRDVQKVLREPAHQAISIAIDSIPDLRKSVQNLKHSAGLTREVLEKVLSNQVEVEKSLARLRDQSVALVKEIPAASATMGKGFRALAAAKGLPDAVRQVSHTAREAAKSLPDTKKSLTELSQFLKTSKSTLESVVQNEDKFKQLVDQLREVCVTLAKALPETVNQLNVRLAEEERVLGEIEILLNQSEGELPGYAQNISMLVEIIRWLAYVTSGLLLLHVLRTVIEGQMRATA